jgi:hypothetical protein
MGILDLFRVQQRHGMGLDGAVDDELHPRQTDAIVG